MSKADNSEGLKKNLAFAVLTVMVLCIAGRFGVMPLLGHIDAMDAQATEVESKLDSARQMIKDESRTLADYDEATETLKRIVSTYVPPSENPLSWASQHIYYVGRQIDANVQKVIPHPGRVASGIPEEQLPRFIPYRVRVQASCSYSRGIQLIRVLEKSNPFICISEVSIVSQSDNVELHQFSFVAEWPSWAAESAKQWFSML